MKRGSWFVASWKSALSQYAKAILSPWKGCDRGAECGMQAGSPGSPLSNMKPGLQAGMF